MLFRSTFLTLALRFKKDGLTHRKIAKITALLGFLLVALTFLSGILMDPSCDGREYHQMGTALLEKGWNPIYDDIYAFCAEHFKNIHWSLVWNEAYVKFSEIFAANVLLLTGKIETGKVFNGISGLIALFYAFYVLSKPSFSRLDTKMRAVFSFLLVYNPIFLAQFFTYYIDGLMYLYFLISTLSILDMETALNKNQNAKTLAPPIIPRLIFIMSSTILMNIKLGGILCFVCILLCAALSFALGRFWPVVSFKTFNTKVFWSSVLTIILLTLLSGINPYFTNVSKERHPLYPLAGREKIDIITPNMPKAFKDKPVAYKFFTSLFSRTDNFTFSIDKNPRLKIPLTVHKSEITKFDDTDTRIAGFGVFFSAIFLMALVLAIISLVTLARSLAWKNNSANNNDNANFKNCNKSANSLNKANPFTARQGNKEIALILSILIISIILNPESWWARYIPQLWAVIIFIALFVWQNLPEISSGSNSKTRFIKGFTGALLFLMFLNSFLINGASTAWAAKYTYRTKTAINKLKALQKQDPEAIVRHVPQNEFASMEVSYTRKLREAGVKYDIQR